MAKRIIQQEQNAAQRYGAIRNGGDAVIVVLSVHTMVQNTANARLKKPHNMTRQLLLMMSSKLGPVRCILM